MDAAVLTELAMKTGPWAVGALFVYLVLKALIDKGFRVEVPPSRPRR